MKKITILMMFIFLIHHSNAQIGFFRELDKGYSENLIGDFQNMIRGITIFDSLNTKYDSVKRVFASKYNQYLIELSNINLSSFRQHDFGTTRKKVNEARRKYLDSLDIYKKLFEYIINVQKVNYHIAGRKDYNSINKQRDKGMLKIKHPFRKYSYESMRFFENDSTHNKFFKNNTVNYNPKTKQMSLYTEALNDYFAAFRIGIGFQVKTNPAKDTTKLTDSSKSALKNEDLLGNLQNQGGGDFNVNVSYPFFRNLAEMAWINYRIYGYGNIGVSLPILNKTTSEYILNSDIGIQGTFYSNGFNDKLTIFGSFKQAYYFGNKTYRKIIKDADATASTSFMLTKTSIGLAFLDGYRIAFDFYPAWGSKFIKANFPATVSFIIRPSDNK